MDRVFAEPVDWQRPCRSRRAAVIGAAVQLALSAMGLLAAILLRRLSGAVGAGAHRHTLKAILIVLAVIALDTVGIDLTALALFSGAVAVGLGLQKSPTSKPKCCSRSFTR